jgi:hypothetical protein
LGEPQDVLRNSPSLTRLLNESTVHSSGRALGEAKVSDLDVEVFVEEEVLGLEVAMDDHGAMAELDASDDLLEELARLVFAQLRGVRGGRVGETLPRETMKSKSSPPGTCSMTTKMSEEVSMISYLPRECAGRALETSG